MGIFKPSDPVERAEYYLRKGNYKNAYFDFLRLAEKCCRNNDFQQGLHFYLKNLDAKILGDISSGSNIIYSSGVSDSLECAINLFEYRTHEMQIWIDKMKHYNILDGNLLMLAKELIKKSNLSEERKTICYNFIQKESSM